MKQFLTALIFFVVPIITMAQYDSVFVKYMHLHGDGESYYYDTLFTSRPTENHILVGTTMLPGSGNQFSAYPYDLWFSGFSGSDCNSHSESDAYGADKVLDVEWTDSTLIINCQIGANCCYDFLGDISIDDNGVLNLIYHGYGEHCACNCCFGLTYSFRIEHLYNEEKKQLTAIIINGDESTRKDVK